MDYCAIKDGRAVTGDSFTDIGFQAMNVTKDLEKGVLYINGVADTITYSKELSKENMKSFMGHRVAELLTRHGWKLYKAI